jgi:hypothetical protein
MRQFALKANGQTFNCDTDGRVMDSANVIGTWSSTPDNKIRITPQAGAVLEVPVQWRFNESNQLTLNQGGTVGVHGHQHAAGAAPLPAGEERARRRS